MIGVTQLKDRIFKIAAHRTFVLSFFLAVLTAAVYLPVWRCQFINFDDNYYVVLNPHIRQGMTWEGLKWALSAGLFSGTGGYIHYWQPLTVISHMLDIQFFGLNPAGHHLTNLALHVMNVLLLFGILKKTTGSDYRSAFAAAVFGIHPVQTEAVAWVAARKDVLSMALGLLTLWAYVGYVNKPNLKRWLVVFILFCSALMAKPLLMVLPLIFLILDGWPLARAGTVQGAMRWRVWEGLIAEKSPFLILAVFSCLLAFLTQSGQLPAYPWGLKISNALVFYAAYLAKWMVPGDLSVWYPYPGADPQPPPFSFWQIGAAAAMMAVIFVTAVRLSGRRPFLLAGWLWFVGTLLPTIWVRMHDRYMYLPSIGLAILAAWGIPALADRLRVKKAILAAGAAVILLIWSGLAFIQAGYWKNSETLFKHSIAVVKNNFAMEFLLGNTLLLQGRNQEALPHYEKAVKIKTDWGIVHYELGVVLLNLNREDEAERHFREAIRLAPAEFPAYKKLIEVMDREGRIKESEQCLAEARKNVLPVLLEALRREPREPKGLSDTAVLLARTGSGEEAASYFERFFEIDPYNVTMYDEYGKLLERLGRFDDALVLYDKAVRSNPDFEAGYLRIGDLLVRQGLDKKAVPYYKKALELNPGHSPAAGALTRIRAEAYRKLAGHYREAVRLNPQDAKAHYNLGFSLASLDSCGEAVGHYRTAVGLDPKYLQAYFNLGNCYAKLGEFEDAAAAYEKALALDPAGEKIHYNMGRALEKLGKTDEAGRHYAEALRIRPGFEDARKRLAALVPTAQDPGRRQGPGKNP